MYIGLDVHKRVCYGTVMDEKGRVVKQAKLFTSFFSSIKTCFIFAGKYLTRYSKV